MKLNPDNFAGISITDQREYLNTACKLNFLRMPIIAVFVFVFFPIQSLMYNQIETLSKLRIMAAQTAFLMSLFDEEKRKGKNRIEVQLNKDKKSAAIN